MNKNKIIVTGSPGAGKSTFARRLSEITGLPLYHLDMIWHKADRTTVSREEFDETLRGIMSGGEWIIDGHYRRTLRGRIEQCGRVYLLDFPVEVCLAGARERRGKKREDMPWVEREEDGEELERYIREFPETWLPEVYGILSEFPEKEVVIFRSREVADEYLNRLEMEGEKGEVKL
ncbi:MAG: adenylate kinase [Ruminococcus sp.]|nr:adenylate kinase [Ruminococcus sp.]